MKWPWVSRAWYEAYLRERESYDKLVGQMVAMKRKGFELPYSGQRVKPAAPEPEEAGLRRAEAGFIADVRQRERAFVENAKTDLINKGADPVTAEREARRLLEEANSMHPAGG